MSKNVDLGPVYAHAFLLLLHEKKVNFNTYLATNLFLLELFTSKKSNFWEWLQSLPSATVKKELELIFAHHLQRYWLNLMLILLEDDHFGLLPLVLSLIKKLLEQKLNIKTAHLYSAISLQTDQLEKIKIKLEKKLTCVVNLVPKIDVNLIAGVRVEVENQIFDNSLRKKLNDFKGLAF